MEDTHIYNAYTTYNFFNCTSGITPSREDTSLYDIQSCDTNYAMVELKPRSTTPYACFTSCREFPRSGQSIFFILFRPSDNTRSSGSLSPPIRSIIFVESDNWLNGIIQIVKHTVRSHSKGNMADKLLILERTCIWLVLCWETLYPSAGAVGFLRTTSKW